MSESTKLKRVDSILTILIIITFLITIIFGGVVVYGSNESDERETGINEPKPEWMDLDTEEGIDKESKGSISLEDNLVTINHNEPDNASDNKGMLPIGEFKITAFTAGYESTGKTPDHPYYGITASGNKVKENHTIASDWDVLSPGTKVYIQDVGIRVVEDKGGKVNGNHIDLYIEELDEALEWGVQYKEVWIIENEEGIDNAAL